MRREDQKSPRGKHKRQQKGRRKVVRREEGQGRLKRPLSDARAPPVIATELDLVAPVLLIAGSAHVIEWRLNVWLLVGQGVPRWGLSSMCAGLR